MRGVFGIRNRSTADPVLSQLFENFFLVDFGESLNLIPSVYSSFFLSEGTNLVESSKQAKKTGGSTLGIVFGSVAAFLVFAVFVPGLVVWLVSLVK